MFITARIRKMGKVIVSVSLFTPKGGTYLGFPTLDGWVPTLAGGWGGGYLPWLVDQGVPTLEGVPTLAGGWGYLPWTGDVPTLASGQGVPQGRYPHPR